MIPKVVHSPETLTLPGPKCAKAPPASTEGGSLQLRLRTSPGGRRALGPAAGEKL